MAKPPIKVCLTNQGEDTETPWAEDLGPAPGPPRSRKVRLINVPFLHAKPTWGDVIIVSPVEEGFPQWDRDGVPWAQIESRIAEDGGRWAMIIDYVPHPDAKAPFDALARACAEHDVVCEGAWGPREGVPGRAYLAVKNEITDAALMAALRGAALPCELVQIHPEPVIRPRAKAAAATPVATAKSVAVAQPAVPTTKKPAAPATKKPSAPATTNPAAPATTKPAAPAAKKPAAAPATNKRAGAAAKKSAASATKKSAAPAAKKPTAPATKKPATPATKKPAAPAAKKPSATKKPAGATKR